jgi:hypothetical protein
VISKRTAPQLQPPVKVGPIEQILRIRSRDPSRLGARLEHRVVDAYNSGDLEAQLEGLWDPFASAIRCRSSAFAMHRGRRRQRSTPITISAVASDIDTAELRSPM